ncbi:type VII secretion integral membrane protein EccD [Solihabitans fulvus]|uniref:Type VII secretion integral membrane protein EccD n=1 Tax=Solihabitans fulvus TaxID=1892852 RepID=A0A5B2XUI4_9PSEU|nr:type VII secretion integral membrane protein EccD [Solihabitans fulvus]KAA2266474.1 type VII secretion integral membrane protein EccD [Solihabitans fulvus]
MISSARRVTVVTPLARVDVALPVQSTLAELVPQLVRLSGAETQAPSDSPGWVLTRLGGPPLPPGLTVNGAGVRDGEVLYLGPRERHVTPLLFDDVVDAIASAAGTRAGAWTPRVARRAGIGAAVTLFLGATLLLLAGTSGSLVAPLGFGAFALVLLLGGGALGRAYGDADSGAACAVAGLVAALLAGMTALPPHTAWPIATGPLAAGLAAVTVYGVLAAVVVADRLAWFSAVSAAAGLGAIASAVVLLTDVTSAGAAAGLAAVATALSAVAPMISLRLSRMPLPRVPADMDSFRAEEGPTLGQDVLDQTSVAERVLAGLLSAFGVVVFGCVMVLLRDDSPWQAALAGALGVAWLLRSRSYAGTAQRIALVAVGLAVLARLGLWLALRGDRVVVFGSVLAIAVAAVVCLLYANRVVRGRKSPYWARLMDIAEFLSLIALLPIVGVVVGIYDAVRGAVG